MEIRDSIQFGQATATVINIGEFQADLADWLTISESEWPARYAVLREQKMRVPVQCVHVALPGVSLLVDASLHEAPADSPMLIPNYQPPPGLTAQLAGIGVQPEMITDVIITHIHFDHYNAVTQRDNDQVKSTFPHARHYLGRADWERPETQKALEDPTSLTSQTLGVLHTQGLLTLVGGNLDLGHDIQIIAAPGETPGHQLVHVRSAGQSLYCIGDLYHHPIEFEQPTWTVQWADIEANRASRQAFIEAALESQAFIITTHIPSIYRLQRTASGIEWVTV